MSVWASNYTVYVWILDRARFEHGGANDARAIEDATLMTVELDPRAALDVGRRLVEVATPLVERETLSADAAAEH